MSEYVERTVYTGRWIIIIDEGVPAGLKTHVYRVESTGAVLGTVKWYAQWRCYSFFPSEQTVYENTCLHEIADFCTHATVEYKSAKQRVACGDKWGNQICCLDIGHSQHVLHTDGSNTW